MSQNMTDVMVTGLKNAHGLESQAVQVLERQAERLTDYPELQGQLRRHLEESRMQREMLEGLLTRFNTSASTLKDAALGFAANLQAMVHAVAEDEVLKNTYTSYAFEHFEIASYRSLITMARRVGDAEVERVCTEILRQEEAMASWLGEHLDTITEQYLDRQGHADAQRQSATASTVGA